MVLRQVDLEGFLHIKDVVTARALDFPPEHARRAEIVRLLAAVNIFHVAGDPVLSYAHERAQFALEAFHSVLRRAVGVRTRRQDAEGRGARRRSRLHAALPGRNPSLAVDVGILRAEALPGRQVVQMIHFGLDWKLSFYFIVRTTARRVIHLIRRNSDAFVRPKNVLRVARSAGIRVRGCRQWLLRQTARAEGVK